MSADAFFAGGIMVGVMIVAWVIGRKAKKQEQYDEMQLQIRATGYRLGFFTTLSAGVVLIFAGELGLFQYVTPSMGIFAAMMAGIVTFVVYCILHGAYLAPRENGVSTLAIFGVVVAVNGVVAVMKLVNGEALENGRLTLSSGAPMLLFVCFLAILTALLVKKNRSGRESEE